MKTNESRDHQGHGVSPLLIYNETRYCTEDISRMAMLAWGKWRPDRLIVSYYSPSKSVREESVECQNEGVFAKISRNADENTGIKKLGLVNPARFQDLSDLERLATAGGQAPQVVTKQVMYRLHFIRYWNRSSCSQGLNTAMFSRDKDRIGKALEEGLTLRFQTRKPSPEVLTWRGDVVAARALHRDLGRALKTQVEKQAEAQRQAAGWMEKALKLGENKAQTEQQLSAAGERMADLLSRFSLEGM